MAESSPGVTGTVASAQAGSGGNGAGNDSYAGAGPGGGTYAGRGPGGNTTGTRPGCVDPWRRTSAVGLDEGDTITVATIAVSVAVAWARSDSVAELTGAISVEVGTAIVEIAGAVTVAIAVCAAGTDVGSPVSGDGVSEGAEAPASGVSVARMGVLGTAVLLCGATGIGVALAVAALSIVRALVAVGGHGVALAGGMVGLSRGVGLNRGRIGVGGGGVAVNGRSVEVGGGGVGLGGSEVGVEGGTIGRIGIWVAVGATARIVGKLVGASAIGVSVAAGIEGCIPIAVGGASSGVLIGVS